MPQDLQTIKRNSLFEVGPVIRNGDGTPLDIGREIEIESYTVTYTDLDPTTPAGVLTPPGDGNSVWHFQVSDNIGAQGTFTAAAKIKYNDNQEELETTSEALMTVTHIEDAAEFFDMIFRPVRAA